MISLILLLLFILGQTPPIAGDTWTDGFVKIMTVITPIVIAVIGYFQIQASRRADAAATLAAAKAEEVKEAAKEAKSAAEAVRTTLRETTSGTNSKLDVIHSLSNSALTSSMKNQLASAMREVVILHEMQDLREVQNLKPSSAAKLAIEVATAHILELQKTIQERESQQRIIDEKLAQKDAPEQPAREKEAMHVIVDNKLEQPIPIIPAT